MSDEQIRKAIEKFNKKLPLIPEGEDRDLCLVGLENFQNELARRNQKKSESQPTGNTRQLPPNVTLPTVAEMQEWQKKAEKEIQQTHEEIANMKGDDKAEYLGKRLITQYANMVEREQRVIGTVNAAPVITVHVVEIALSSGTKQMNRTEIMTMLKTWFKRVATSKAMEEGRFSDAYGGAMGQDTWKLFNGWRMIYNETKEGTEYPPLLDCFPGYKNAKTIHKVNAEILWRWASNDK